MKKDRFLLGILIFILVLVAAALVLYFSGSSVQAYLPEDSPEAIVHNYVLAVSNGDYEKAYGYIAEGEDKPTNAEFRRFFTTFAPSQNASLRIGAADVIDEEAIVRTSVLWGSSGPFDSGYTSDESALLVLQEGNWKIKQIPYPFWDFNWLNKTVPPK